MMKRSPFKFRILVLWMVLGGATLAEAPRTPDQIYGDLFTAVQMSRIFPDGKTFVDCVPKRKPEEILADYNRMSKEEGFELAAFVKENFLIPGDDVVSHINRLWKQLKREADLPVEGSSLLPLPHPYIVPGGRFREVYYWDSYFTMLGLKESGESALIADITKNFAYLIGRYGFIPNGNRSYYLSRSQPPFFSLMVELLAEVEGEAVYTTYLPALKSEYAYWMDQGAPETHHVVKMPDGSLMNRYWDRLDIPRQESYLEDLQVSRKSQRAPGVVFRNLRSAAESGWDFSSRWCADSDRLETIRTTELIPVDLNCLLYHLELTLARACRQSGDVSGEADFQAKAAARKEAIQRYCWSESAGWYVDYDITSKLKSGEMTLAGMFPLFFKVAPDAHIAPIASHLETRFLRPGGVVTTLKTTGQQWDAPNGWAPLQWITIQGFTNYGQDRLAREIAARWIALNIRVFTSTGKLMEKYDVVDMEKEAGGGEYPSQDGFGWTNGVLLKLIRIYGMPEER